MRRKILSLLVLLTIATGVWAQTKYLYLVVSGTSATLMYGNKGSNPYYDGSFDWRNSDGTYYTGYSAIKVLNVDESCGGYNGESLAFLFDKWTSLTTINDIDRINTDNVNNMASMFKNCTALTTLNITGWDTSKVTKSDNMFYGCINLNKTVTANEGTTGEYWATFYDVCNFLAPSGTQVFKVNLTGTSLTMTPIEERIVKSGEGVVLKSNSGSITLTPTIATADYTGNSLVGPYV